LDSAERFCMTSHACRFYGCGRTFLDAARLADHAEAVVARGAAPLSCLATAAARRQHAAESAPEHAHRTGAPGPQVRKIAGRRTNESNPKPRLANAGSRGSTSVSGALCSGFGCFKLRKLLQVAGVHCTRHCTTACPRGPRVNRRFGCANSVTRWLQIGGRRRLSLRVGLAAVRAWPMISQRSASARRPRVPAVQSVRAQTP
jgi:hypothetical protein